MEKSLKFVLLLMFLTVNLGHVKCQTITTVGEGGDNSNEMNGMTGVEYQSTGIGAANSNEMTATTVMEYQSTGTGAANSNEMTGETIGPPSNPACPVELTTVKINVPKLLGVWFLVESYPQMPVVYSSCEFSNITYVSPNSFRVNTFMFKEFTSASSVTSSGDSTERGADSYLMTVNRNFISQHVDVICTSNPNIQITNWAILAANFTEYVIHYACAFENGKFLGQRVHIVSRYPNPSSEIMDNAYKAMERFGLSTKPLVKINQSLKTCAQYTYYQEILKVSEQKLGDWKKPQHHTRPCGN